MQAWIELIVFSYFCFAAAYSLLFSLAGLFYRTPRYTSNEKKQRKIAVFIPSYKEDSVIVHVAKAALHQTYPKANYDVIVIADSLQPTTVEALRQLDIIVHEVMFEKSTKVKSLQSALAAYPGYEIAVILDADNVMKANFLELVNRYYNEGWRAIQGQRVAKNNNTPFAVLDGISEGISNHINRAGATALGLSSPIIGSGMAYDFKLFREIMASITSVGGFDKELQVRVLERNERILYLKDAVVLDEKVENPEVFQNQRKRWMSSHYIYAKKFFMTGLRGIFKGKLSLFNIAVLLSVQLPRVLNLGVLFLLALSAIVLRDLLWLPFWTWPALLGLYLLSFFLAIPRSFYNRELLGAIVHLPRAFASMLLLHFRLKGADKKFIHTPHGFQSPDVDITKPKQP